MSSSPEPKQALFEQLAVIARALGSAARLELLDFLAQGGRNVDELAQATGLSVANTSKHLQQLKSAGLVEARREGKHIRYRLSDDRTLDAIRDLRILAETHLDRVGIWFRVICAAGMPWSRCRRANCSSGHAMVW